MAEKTGHVNTSGWKEEEAAALDQMVKDDGTDRSKFIRQLVRKEAEERARQDRILKAVLKKGKSK